MGEIGSAISGQMGAMNVKVLNEAQDMAKQQAAQILDSLPQAANLPGVGGNIDITA